MADAAVTFLLENLTKLISQKAHLIIGVKDEAESLEDELKIVQAYLASFRENEKPVVLKHLEQFRRAAWEGADIIDEYVSLVAAQQRRGSFWGKPGKVISRLFHQGRVAKDIKRIREKFQELYSQREKLGIQLLQQGDVKRQEDGPSMRRVLVEETDVVGFDQDAQKIIERLTEGDNNYGRDVVPIIGPAGIGKTTLAWKVFNDPKVVSNFSFRAWVSVFQGYRVRDLLQAILACAKGVGANSMKEVSEADLGMELREYLRSTHYLIVLDDVWETELWDKLGYVFSDNMLKSRIILTTQLFDVARHVKPRYAAHEVNYLTTEDSQELFFKRIFVQGETCSDELKALGKEIVGQCGGLPLAVVVLAGVLLKKEKTIKWWEEVSASVSSILGTDYCSKVLGLSYENLPHHLRPCFLYFSIFPRHKQISARKLVRFWIAEGFVHKNGSKSVEEVGDDYLEELVARNLVQMSQRRVDGSLKSCFIHELLQELAAAKAKEELFIEILKEKDSLIPSNMRRLIFHTFINRSIFSNTSNSKLRAIICFDIDDRPLTVKEWKLLEKRFPLLKVLDLWDLGVESIPKEIANLVHLRYLRLRSLTEKDLPDTVCKLWNLQTLELTAPCIDPLKINIWKMQELRHFYFPGQAVIPDPPKDSRICELRNLLTLSSISPDCCKESILSKWPNLLKLGIYGDLEQHMVSAFEHLSRLVSLQTLKLERDRRSNELVCLPSSVQFPPNITKLTLSETQLLHDPMTVLGELPNLQILKLKEAAYSGWELGSGNYNGFPKLQVLKLINMAIKRWTVSEGSMLSLKSVLIKRCGKLGGLPLLLENMSTFVELELWSPPDLVENDARKIEEGRGKRNFKLVIR